MNQKFRFTAEPRSALCLLSMALMLLSPTPSRRP